jgi:hypothetical protein
MDALVNAGINAKLDLAEDKAFTNLARKVTSFISDPSLGTEGIDTALSYYIIREIQQAMLQSRNNISLLELLESQIQSVLDATESVQSNQRAFMNAVEEAHNYKKQRIDYNTISGEILDLKSREESLTEIENIEDGITQLQKENDRIARLTEYRRRQLQPIMDWARCLETGQTN